MITVLGRKALLLKRPKLFLYENLSKVNIAISKMADFVDDPSFLQKGGSWCREGKAR